MAELGELTIQIMNDHADGHEEELAGLARRLRQELLTLKVASVEPPADRVPEGGKGIGTAIGWLVVHVGQEPLRNLIAAVADWASRNERQVEVILDGDVLRLGRATRHQQEQAFTAWLTRHTPVD